MKKIILASLIACSSLCSYALTPFGSFTCTIKTPQHLTVNEINGFLTKLDMENYRLYDKRTKLEFDNGFEITMLSAVEAEQQHLIQNTGLYQEMFPKEFRMPVFHMTDNGFVSAGYTAYDKKYSAIK